MTIITELAKQQLSNSEQKKMIKEFSKPTPTREVSIISSRTFLKEGIITKLEEIIIKNLPKEVSSHKMSNYEIIPID